MVEIANVFNVYQELFLVVFSILYGVMLQSMTGLQPFPLARAIFGFKNREGTLITDLNCSWTTNEELIRMWRRRIIWSFFILNLLPIVYLWGVLSMLSVFPNDFFAFNSEHLYRLGIVFWSALGVFGFYRLYHSLATWRWSTLFGDIVKKMEKRGVSFDPKGQLLWGLFFYLFGALLLYTINQTNVFFSMIICFLYFLLLFLLLIFREIPSWIQHLRNQIGIKRQFNPLSKFIQQDMEGVNQEDSKLLWDFVFILYSVALSFSVHNAHFFEIFPLGNLVANFLYRVPPSLSDRIILTSIVYAFLIVSTVILIAFLRKRSILVRLRSFYLRIFLSFGIGISPMFCYYLLLPLSKKWNELMGLI